jgi:hypothetical protein
MYGPRIQELKYGFKLRLRCCEKWMATDSRISNPRISGQTPEIRKFAANYSATHFEKIKNHKFTDFLSVNPWPNFSTSEIRG